MKLLSLIIIFFQGKITLENPDLKKFLSTSEGGKIKYSYFIDCTCKNVDNNNIIRYMYMYTTPVEVCILYFLSLCLSGRLITGLVREFLEYFDLDFSIAVFDPETNFVSDSQYIYVC